MELSPHCRNSFAPLVSIETHVAILGVEKAVRIVVFVLRVDVAVDGRAGTGAHDEVVDLDRRKSVATVWATTDTSTQNNPSSFAERSKSSAACRLAITTV